MAIYKSQAGKDALRKAKSKIRTDPSSLTPADTAVMMGDYEQQFRAQASEEEKIHEQGLPPYVKKIDRGIHAVIGYKPMTQVFRWYQKRQGDSKIKAADAYHAGRLEQADTYQTQLGDIRKQTARTEMERETHRNALADLKDQMSQKKEDIRRLQDELGKNKSDFVARRKINAAKEEYALMKTDFDTYSNEIERFEADYIKLTVRAKAVQTQIESTRAQAHVTFGNIVKAEIQRDIQAPQGVAASWAETMHINGDLQKTLPTGNGYSNLSPALLGTIQEVAETTQINPLEEQDDSFLKGLRGVNAAHQLALEQRVDRDINRDWNDDDELLEKPADIIQ